ncbi:hypothetical protein NDU88_005161, partial [Pleurodeles waltl]
KITNFFPQDGHAIKVARKRYKDELAARKTELRESAWEELIEASKNRDTTAFWQVANSPLLIDKVKMTVGTVIPAQVWVDHLSKKCIIENN